MQTHAVAKTGVSLFLEKVCENTKSEHETDERLLFIVIQN